MFNPTKDSYYLLLSDLFLFLLWIPRPTFSTRCSRVKKSLTSRHRCSINCLRNLAFPTCSGKPCDFDLINPNSSLIQVGSICSFWLISSRGTYKEDWIDYDNLQVQSYPVCVWTVINIEYSLELKLNLHVSLDLFLVSNSPRQTAQLSPAPLPLLCTIRKGRGWQSDLFTVLFIFLLQLYIFLCQKYSTCILSSYIGSFYSCSNSLPPEGFATVAPQWPQ